MRHRRILVVAVRIALAHITVWHLLALEQESLTSNEKTVNILAAQIICDGNPILESGNWC
jgi:hypothetical protein